MQTRITLASIIFLSGLILLFLVVPPLDALEIGSASLSIKGVVGSIIIFFVVWFTLKKYNTTTRTAALYGMVLSTLPIALGEFGYHLVKQLHFGRTWSTVSLMAIVQDSIFSIFIGAFFAGLIVYNRRVKNLSKTIGIAIIIWIIIGMIIKKL